MRIFCVGLLEGVRLGAVVLDILAVESSQGIWVLPNQGGKLSDIVKCKNCGRRYNAAVIRNCPICRATELNLGISESPGFAGSVPNNEPRPTATLPHPEVRDAALDAVNVARALTSVTTVITVLGVIGGVLVAFIGFFLLQTDETRVTGIIVLSFGFASLLFWIFIGAIAHTIAAAVRAIGAALMIPNR